MSIDCGNCEAWCCKIYGLIIQKRSEGCLHLTSDNKCNKYATRPSICNTDVCYELMYKQKMSREEYDRLNKETCKSLKTRYEELLEKYNKNKEE